MYPPVPGESAGERCARVVRELAGVSLSVSRSRLVQLVGGAETTPAQALAVTTWRTNCASFSLGVLRAVGCPHPLLAHPLLIGAAFSWLVKVGDDFGAWRVPAPGAAIPVGACLWYAITGTNDDHAEWVLSLPDAAGLVEHGGGGRPDNAITVGKGDIHTSWGRPIHRWLDTSALQIPVMASDPVAPNGITAEVIPSERPTEPEIG